MVERLSDIYDIFILFIKIQMESSPRQVPTGLDGFLFMHAITHKSMAGIKFFMTSCLLIRVRVDLLSVLTDVNGPEKKVRVCHISRISGLRSRLKIMRT